MATKPTILIVGDGNFSFAASVAKGCARAFDLTATCFDDEKTLEARYPESVGIVRRLRQRPNVTNVVHGVDATALEALSQSEAWLSGRKFDAVVFNHPHLGTEDARAHASLLAHFFDACKAVLAPALGDEGRAGNGGGGLVHVTLAEDQPVNWRLVEQAERVGYELLAKTPFLDHAFGGYERRRTLNGRSFAQRAATSETFTFGLRAPRALAGNGGTNQNAAAATAAAAAQASSPAPALVQVPWCSMLAKADAKASKKRKRTGGGGRGGDTAGRSPEDARDGGGGCGSAEEKPFACSQCTRRFKSEQGLRTHVHMVHELGTAECVAASDAERGAGGVGTDEVERKMRKDEGRAEAGDAPAADGRRFTCSECGRVLPNQEALAQHMIAKHTGTFTEIKPDWHGSSIMAVADGCGEADVGGGSGVELGQAPNAAVATDVTAGLSAGVDVGVDAATSRRHVPAWVCTVCGESFASESALVAHTSRLKPVEKPRKKCPHCGRTFVDDRALKQHLNRCTAAAASAAAEEGTEP